MLALAMTLCRPLGQSRINTVVEYLGAFDMPSVCPRSFLEAHIQPPNAVLGARMRPGHQEVVMLDIGRQEHHIIGACCWGTATLTVDSLLKCAASTASPANPIALLFRPLWLTRTERPSGVNGRNHKRCQKWRAPPCLWVNGTWNWRADDSLFALSRQTVPARWCRSLEAGWPRPGAELAPYTQL